MTNVPVNITRKLKTPRAAAIAGILFALLYGTSLVIIRLTIPAEISGDSAWLENSSKMISVALNLVPYAGIAFLWFIGVNRDRLGNLEDRFVSTVFQGSGILFLAMTFVGAALAGGLVNSYAIASRLLIETGVYTYSRAVMYLVLNIYAIRMAGVFMISLGTIWLRTGVMHRGWTYLSYTLALVLLVSIGFSLWVTLIFPVWVLVVSVYFLIKQSHHIDSESEISTT
jgi:hypothetical protein